MRKEKDLIEPGVLIPKRRGSHPVDEKRTARGSGIIEGDKPLRGETLG